MAAMFAEFRLYDVLSQRAARRQALCGRCQRLAPAGHRVADQVYERLTGERGYFDTQVAFIDETGPKDRRRKRLAIMDQDGANVRLLSQGGELVLTPRFSPTAQEITYLQYTGEQPRVFLMNMDTGQREMVGNFPGMTFAPRFSPDGQRLVMSIGEGGATGIVEMDLRTRQTRRLTQSSGIDTGPCYSPDGRRIVFESDRDGAQQLHVMSADGSGAKRISYGDGPLCDAGMVAPRRPDRLHQADERQLPDRRDAAGRVRASGSSPRGTTTRGQPGPPTAGCSCSSARARAPAAVRRLFSIDLTGYNERQVQTPSFGSDPAWGPLRN